MKREWFDALSREILNPNYGLFLPCANGCVYQPNPASAINRDHLAYFRFAGRAVGLAIFHKQLLDVHFTTSFFKHMSGEQIDVSDLESIDPDFHRNMQFIQDHSVEGMELVFEVSVEEFGTHHSVELVPGGKSIEVTDENKSKYIALYCNLVTTRRIEQQTFCFKEGFHEFVPRSLVKLFSPAELQLLISGLPNVKTKTKTKTNKNTNYKVHSNLSLCIHSRTFAQLFFL